MGESDIKEKGKDGCKKLKVGLSVRVTPSNTERKIVVGRKLWDDVSSSANSYSFAKCTDGESVIEKTASLPRQVVAENMSNSVEIPSPPMVESLNDTRRKKLCFSQFITRLVPWLLLTFFIYLHDQLSSIHSIIIY